MIKIKITNLEDIKNEYLSKLSKKKFNRKKGNGIHNHWIDNRNRIISATPIDFQNIVNEFNAQNQSGFDKFNIYMEGQYEELFYNQKVGYWLAEKLDIRTCPYCNRHYTFTIEKKKTKAADEKIIKPQFDHFYPKSKHPYLALSFYNLIPSCPTCNKVKRDEEISINPYWEDFQENNCKFVLKDKNISRPAIIDKNNIEVGFNFEREKNIKRAKHKCEDNIDVFGLRELYNKHTDYVEEIIDKAQAYNSTYYDSLIQSFRGLGATPEQIDRYVWGNYTEIDEQFKRPLSKLTRDVLEQLGIK
ncbi:hypothetical protein AGMMS49982_15750 [Bacteroidia bacterium]|nr:hypothetical protein AGMMS49982_15750 [Bacteroidia bacterium]